MAQGDQKNINGHTFLGFGSHFDCYPHTYLTAAAAIGITKGDVDMFITKLNETFVKWKKKVEKDNMAKLDDVSFNLDPLSL